MTLKGRDLLSIEDLSLEELQEILDTAFMLKRMKRSNINHKPLEGKTLGMIFEKASTRTRVSFEVAMYELGGYALFLGAQDLQLRRGETIADTARTLSRYLNGIMARVYSHNTLVELAEYASIPIINGLSDLYHPCQAIGDFMTIKEKKGTLKGLTMAYIGDGNNVCNALLMGAAKLGMNMRVASPSSYEPPSFILDLVLSDAQKSGSEIKILNDPIEAVKNVDVIYTDVWASMGQESEAEERKKAFHSYQVNSNLLMKASPDVIVLHCLPAHRGEEITDEIMDGPNSVVFDQAENRLHAQKAILALLL